MTFDQVIKGARLVDTDCDGLSNAEDNCPAIANPDQKDTDGNGIGDACQGPTKSRTDKMPTDSSQNKTACQEIKKDLPRK